MTSFFSRRGTRSLVAAGIILTMMSLSALAQGRRYGDDPIVRDLKAGKLTVHQAQLLQQRRHVPVAVPASGRPRKAARSTVPQHRSAPIRHRTPVSHSPARHGKTAHLSAAPSSRHHTHARMDRHGKAGEQSGRKRKHTLKHVDKY